MHSNAEIKNNSTAASRRAERNTSVLHGFIYAGLTLWSLIVLFPFYWMIITSIKRYGSYNAERIPQLFPTSPTFETTPMRSPQCRLATIFSTPLSLPF